jgi:hypothetical protein
MSTFSSRRAWAKVRDNCARIVDLTYARDDCFVRIAAMQHERNMAMDTAKAYPDHPKLVAAQSRMVKATTNAITGHRRLYAYTIRELAQLESPVQTPVMPLLVRGAQTLRAGEKAGIPVTDELIDAADVGAAGVASLQRWAAPKPC